MIINPVSMYDTSLAEYMFDFVSQDEVYADFYFTQMKEDVSIAEYCMLRFDDFREYCEKKHGFTIYKHREK